MKKIFLIFAVICAGVCFICFMSFFIALILFLDNPQRISFSSTLLPLLITTVSSLVTSVVFFQLNSMNNRIDQLEKEIEELKDHKNA